MPDDMPTEENSLKKDGYREIPASILKQAPEPRAIRAKRFSRYFFGVGILGAFVLMGYLAFTNQLAASDRPSEIDIEQLVAEYEASSASDSVGALGATAEPANSHAAVLSDVQIQITSEPEGADVEIDGEYVGVTPLAHLLPPGAYILSLGRDEYQPVDTVLVFVEGGQERFSFNLADAAGASLAASDDFRALSRPAIDRAPTPSTNDESARPRVEERSDNERSTQNSAVLVISSHPAGASALLNGRFIGRTPFSTESVSAGTHQLRLFMDEFEPYEETVEVRPGETTAVHGVLVRRAGELTVLVRPWGSIYIDGVLHEAHTDVRYATSVPAGEHTIVAVHPTLGSVSRKVNVRAGNTINITLDLESKQ